MVFLKKFITTGFKSFATKTEFVFDKQMSGVVGPNGSGKSNIVDAIKWVLGEKSNKALRGKTSEDIIFHGSTNHEPSKYAEVTLVFDNSNGMIHYEGKELSVTRRVERGSGNNEYFINGEPARLKDIQNIFLDTGLSKGSLGIISQGTVQWFVEAKPEERRRIFEEAAGIGLYTKQKDEANNQLERTTVNLNNVTSVVNELERTLNKLKKQAEKVLIYKEKRKELTKLDLMLSVKDFQYYSDKLNLANSNFEKAKNELEVFEPNVDSIEQSLKFAKDKLETADKNIESLNNEYTSLLQQINKLEIRKNSIESNLHNDLTSENAEKKAQAYQQLIAATKFEINNAKNNIDTLKGQIEEYNSMIEQLKTRREQLSNQASDLSTKLTETRMMTKNIIEQLNNKNSVDAGPRTIIENRNALSGIKGLVKDFIQTDVKYEKAIFTALGKQVNNVIVQEQDDAVDAINFLKKNQAGKATFLPMSIKPKMVKPEHIEVLKTLTGFVGIASELITTQKQYENIYANLLGSVIIANELSNATKLSNYTYSLYRVVTLDGDIINVGGIMTGGFNKPIIASTVNLEAKLEELNKTYEQTSHLLVGIKQELDETTANFNSISAKQNEKKILLSNYEQTLTNNENEHIRLETEYQQLVNKNNLTKTKQEWNEVSINEELARLNSKKDKLTEQINVDKNTKTIYKSEIQDKEDKLTELRFQIDKYRDQINECEKDKVKCESLLENIKNKLNKDYKMTIEYATENYSGELPMSDNEARELVARLQSEIEKLGSINMEALEELDDIQARFDTLSKQKQDLEDAKNEIVNIITELDNRAREDFRKTIEDVNAKLPEIFRYLFGGGNCQIQYTNPDDILASGLDVIANPPGKNIVHLNLLSGGEKTLVALSILFAILQIKNFPLIILDEAESALDPANVERFANIIHENGDNTQFIVITHRPGTMERCDVLYGATMQVKGVTSIFKISISEAKRDFVN